LSGRFSHSTARQFHTALPSLDHLVEHLIDQNYCSSRSTLCENTIRNLIKANYIDVDYDSISHVLNIKAFWSRSYQQNNFWTETHFLPAKGASLEVGVLVNEIPTEAEELKYSGILVQVGKDDEPSPVLFSFPARHHLAPSEATFATSFDQPTGLHPTLRIALSSPPLLEGLPSKGCALHLYLTLPNAFFIDKYPLSDPLLLKQHNLKVLRALSGSTDLEAPAYLTEEWGSAALFEVATPFDPSTSTAKDDFSVTIPVHLRYQPPSLNFTHTIVDIPAPALFWACPATDSGANTGSLEASPFDRVNLGYDGLFGPRTLFYHLRPSSSQASRDAYRSAGSGCAYRMVCGVGNCTSCVTGDVRCLRAVVHGAEEGFSRETREYEDNAWSEQGWKRRCKWNRWEGQGEEEGKVIRILLFVRI
jgi:hypothetical protein